MTMLFEPLRVASLGTGQEQFVNSYIFEGSEDLPRVYIQANLHGAETQGNAVIAILIEFFKANPPLGTVQLIPMVNPLGINQKVGTHTYGRYHPAEGENYNRAYQDISLQIDFDGLIEDFSGLSIGELDDRFKTLIQESLNKKRVELSQYGLSYNQQLCLLLQQQASKADIVLDLHCDTQSIEHVYAASFELDKAKDLEFPVIYEIPEKFGGALDEACFMPWVNLSKALNLPNPVESYTLELGCEELWDSSLAAEQGGRILSFLAKRGVVAGGDSLKSEPVESFVAKLEKLRKYRSPVGGNIEYYKKPGERVKVGDLLAKIHSFDQNGLKSHSIAARRSGLVMAHLSTSICLEGMKVIQVLEL
ncbi:hypothetical protein GW915_07330 [bacterium]|nr:hypothetical protein [bacterium]